MSNLQELAASAKKVESIPDLFALLRQTLIAMADELPTNYPARKTIVRSLYRTNQAMTMWEASKVFPEPGATVSDLAETATE